jgi:hypothetical protein
MTREIRLLRLPPKLSFRLFHFGWKEGGEEGIGWVSSIYPLDCPLDMWIAMLVA